MDLYRQIVLYTDLCDVSKELQMCKTKYLINRLICGLSAAGTFKLIQAKNPKT